MIIVSHLSVFKNRNFSWYFLGLWLSSWGTWAQRTVQAWLMYDLTNSATWLGIMYLCIQGTAFLAGPWVGVWTDAGDRRRILQMVQIAGFFQSLLIGLLLYFKILNVPVLLVFCVIQGLIESIDIGARHAILPQLVPSGLLPSAIALNSFIFNSSKIIGPMIAAVSIATFGEVSCYFINSGSYLLMEFALYKLVLDNTILTNPPGSTWVRLKSGVQYIFEHREIRELLMFSTLATFFIFPYMSIFPVIARDILKGDAQTLSLITAVNGLGAIFGGLLSRPAVNGNLVAREYLIGRFLFMGLSLGAMSLANSAWSLGITICSTSLFLMNLYPSIAAALQLLLPEAYRGRVMSFYMVTFMGAGPVGSLILGYLTDHLGASFGLRIMSALAILFGLVPVVRNRKRAG